MKKLIFTIVMLIFVSVITLAQNDSLYIYRYGSIICRYPISQIDSITFHKDSIYNTAMTTKLFNPYLNYGIMTDLNGNTYKTIKIGSQIWMAENLRTTKLSDGSDIPQITNSYEWAGLTTSACCTYMNTQINDSIITNGRLYNWFCVDGVVNIAPPGWHVPTDFEWETLRTQLGSLETGGGKLKETGFTHWATPNEGANNHSGFTSIASGARSNMGFFMGIHIEDVFWSSSQKYINYSDNGAYWYLSNNVAGFNNSYTNKQFGFSVRLVKD
ncbi:MAG: fibrobacter succinogenes major paralogous domain-containing protein [Bacteroidales bacterium]